MNPSPARDTPPPARDSSSPGRDFPSPAQDSSGPAGVSPSPAGVFPSPAGVFKALGDPIRRHILVLVAGGEQPAGAIVAAIRAEYSISQPGVSQHLKVLREARLVRVRAEGTRRFYGLDSTGVETAASWLAALADPLRHFANPLDALGTEIARGKRARRATESRPKFGT